MNLIILPNHPPSPRTPKRNLSPASIREHRDIATKAGIKKPVLVNKIHGEKPLFSGSFLAASPDDIIVHEGSKLFFLILTHEVNNVLVVDSSRSSAKLIRHTILSMFPKAHIDVANSGEASLDLIGSNKRHYDIVIAEERLGLDSIGHLSGSELLRLLRRMQESRTQERETLMIGMSSSMIEDCETLRKRGTADLLWGKVRDDPMHSLVEPTNITDYCHKTIASTAFVRPSMRPFERAA